MICERRCTFVGSRSGDTDTSDTGCFVVVKPFYAQNVRETKDGWYFFGDHPGSWVGPFTTEREAQIIQDRNERIGTDFNQDVIERQLHEAAQRVVDAYSRRPIVPAGDNLERLLELATEALRQARVDALGDAANIRRAAWAEERKTISPEEIARNLVYYLDERYDVSVSDATEKVVARMITLDQEEQRRVWENKTSCKHDGDKKPYIDDQGEGLDLFVCELCRGVVNDKNELEF
jgi:hypothetical protein